MNPVLTGFAALFVLIGYFGANGCSTTPPAPSPLPPIYTQVPHPQSMDLADLAAVFQNPKAPSGEAISVCDSDFQKLLSKTKSRSEIEEGAREFVRIRPVDFHWCFYGKLQALEMDLKSDSLFLEEKQKRALDTYEFLVPIARAFVAEFHDSRYLRWAVVRYQKTSSWLFFRKLELTPAGTAELVQPRNPFGLWRSSPEKIPVLEKYQIEKALNPESVLTAGASPDEDTGEAPSPIPSISPSSLPSPTPSPMEVSPPAETQMPIPSPTPFSTPTKVPAPMTTLSPVADSPALDESLREMGP